MLEAGCGARTCGSDFPLFMPILGRVPLHWPSSLSSTPTPDNGANNGADNGADSGRRTEQTHHACSPPASACRHYACATPYRKRTCIRSVAIDDGAGFTRDRRKANNGHEDAECGNPPPGLWDYPTPYWSLITERINGIYYALY